MKRVVSQLRACATVADVTRVVTAESARLFGTVGVTIEIFAADLRPVLAFDTVPWVTTSTIRKYLRFGHALDPLYQRLIATHLPATTEDVVSDVLAYARQFEAGMGDAAPRLAWTMIGPIAADGRLAGAIRLFRDQRFPPGMREEMVVLCLHASGVLSHLGPDGRTDAGLGRLTERQVEIADMVVRGDTNAEIGRQLGLSLASVKKHLAITFDRLQVANRTELAVLVSRSGGAAVVRDAVGAPGDVRVTRAGR
jgi:DNA-binding CsgD family transcriptional regulator